MNDSIFSVVCKSGTYRVTCERFDIDEGRLLVFYKTGSDGEKMHAVFQSWDHVVSFEGTNIDKIKF